MFRLILTLSAITIVTLSSYVYAESVAQEEVSKAQVEMLARVDNAVTEYAKQIGIDNSYIFYCQREMHLHTFDYPTNGSIPFGVNYNKISDSEELKQTLAIREAFEVSYLKLCLARAKNTLREAEEP